MGDLIILKECLFDERRFDMTGKATTKSRSKPSGKATEKSLIHLRIDSTIQRRAKILAAALEINSSELVEAALESYMKDFQSDLKKFDTDIQKKISN